MLIINFNLETENDNITPLTIAHSLIETADLDLCDLEEIAEHLSVYVKRSRMYIEERQGILNMFMKDLNGLSSGGESNG